MIHFESYVHRHLDWQSPTDFIGSPYFQVAQRAETIMAALACPMDLPGVAWLRLFVSASQVNLLDAWNLLWEPVCSRLMETPGTIGAAIPLSPWIVNLLEKSGFSHTNDVVVLRWVSGSRMSEPPPGVRIRAMCAGDLPAVFQVDAKAFQPLWQNSLSSLQSALAQSIISTVVEDASGIIGYQISTSSQMGGHIGRLAVVPEYQGRNLGYALVYDVLRQFERQRIFHVTVNTQRDNLISQSLYAKAGFKKTNEAYQVYLIQL
jgi:ribosomal-protein-alanine N-acetyltransferase